MSSDMRHHPVKRPRRNTARPGTGSDSHQPDSLFDFGCNTLVYTKLVNLADSVSRALTSDSKLVVVGPCLAVGNADSSSAFQIAATWQSTVGPPLQPGYGVKC